VSAEAAGRSREEVGSLGGSMVSAWRNRSSLAVISAAALILGDPACSLLVPDVLGGTVAQIQGSPSEERKSRRDSISSAPATTSKESVGVEAGRIRTFTAWEAAIRSRIVCRT
jgi:hypothetical protein